MKKSFSMLLIVVSMMMVMVSLSGLVSKASGSLHPLEEANVRCDFDGLEAICFGNPDRVSLGFLNVPHHTPKLKLIEVAGNRKTIVLDLKGEDLKDTLFVDVEGRKTNKVARYQGSSMEDVNDFRWTIDMESDIFQKHLYVKEDKLFGKIHFSSGLFYATDLSVEKLRFVSIDNSSQMLSFNRRIARPAMALDLQIGETLVIKGKQVNVRIAAEVGVKYQLEITNIPPADMANMNHFLFYFDILGEKVKRFEPIVVAKAALYPKPLICNAVIFSQSKLN